MECMWSTIIKDWKVVRPSICQVKSERACRLFSSNMNASKLVICAGSNSWLSLVKGWLRMEGSEDPENKSEGEREEEWFMIGRIG